MTNLLTAIVTYFSAAGSGPLSSSITGGIHLRRVADGTALPYCTLTPIASPTDSRYGGVSFSQPQIQFTVWGVGANASLVLAETLMAALDTKTFTLGSASNFYMRRLGEPIAVDDPEENDAGNDVCGWAITYEYATTA